MPTKPTVRLRADHLWIGDIDRQLPGIWIFLLLPWHGTDVHGFMVLREKIIGINLSPWE